MHSKARPSSAPYDIETFAVIIKESKLAKIVDYSDSYAEGYDLYITGYVAIHEVYGPHSEGLFCGGYHAALVLLTIGIIPNVCNIEHKISSNIKSKNHAQKENLQFTYIDREIIGVASLFVGLFPGWYNPSFDFKHQDESRVVRFNNDYSNWVLSKVQSNDQFAQLYNNP